MRRVWRLPFQHISEYTEVMVANIKGKRGQKRTETVSVRLDPKLRYLAELAARKQRRTISSFIEWAIETSLDKVMLVEGFGNDAVSIASRAERLWDVDPVDRFVHLAFHYPALMNHEEQLIWKLVCGNGAFWRGRRNEEQEWVYKTGSESLLSLGNLGNYWEMLGEIARGERPESDLPDMDNPVPRRSVITTAKSDMPEAPIDDEDIPF
jgi:hypothetical protein